MICHFMLDRTLIASVEMSAPHTGDFLAFQDRLLLVGSVVFTLKGDAIDYVHAFLTETSHDVMLPN